MPPQGRDRARRLHHKRGGFTLIEVMVVLIIIGLMSTVLTLGLDSLRGRDDGLALQRLRLVLEASAERAMVRGQPISIEFLGDGYRFSALDADDNWRPLIDPPLFAERLLPPDLKWAGLSLAGRNEALASRLLFGTQAPDFELHVATPQGEARLIGRASGEVSLELPGSATPAGPSLAGGPT